MFYHVIAFFEDEEGHRPFKNTDFWAANEAEASASTEKWLEEIMPQFYKVLGVLTWQNSKAA